MKRIFCPLVLTTTLLLSTSCQYRGTAQSGGFSVHIAWPNRTFAIAAIPTHTDKIELKVLNANAELEVSEDFTRSELSQTRRYTLDIGRKRVTAKALDDSGKVLAESLSTLEILPDQLTRATLELEPVKEEKEPTINHGTGSSGSNNPAAAADNKKPALTADRPLRPGVSRPGANPEPNSDGKVPIKPNIKTPFAPTKPAPFDPALGGGSGDGGGPANIFPRLSQLSLDPSELSGEGYLTKLKIDLFNPAAHLTTANLNWFCEDVSGQVCDAPVPDPNNLRLGYWKAPSPSTQGPYTLGVTIGNRTETVTVTVLQGSGSIGSIASEIEGVSQ